jgi:hypothetical protein
MEERMAKPSEILAQSPAACAGKATGPRNTVRDVMITGMRQIGTVNFDLVVEFELTVMRNGVPPYPVTTLQTVSQRQYDQLRPGMTLPAAVEASEPLAVWLDLTKVR